MSIPVKVRFPPSPTGFCHVGTARMALLNYAFAKKNGGTILFRSEDTDKERSNVEFENDIQEQLHWLSLSWDEFYRQSERTELYTDAIEKMIAAGKAFVSEEPSTKDPSVTVQIVRLRNPGTVITFTDLIRGEITFDTTELKDFAIARAIDDPLYHLSVVVDDGAMGITHVIRGEDHISNTPRQILIQEALGLPRPAYAHYPLSLGSDRSKLSKRNADVAVRSYRAQGILPEALTNYLALLGWTPPRGEELFTLDQFVEDFRIEAVHKSGAIFDVEKLRWFNRAYLKKLDSEEFDTYARETFRTQLAKRDVPFDETVYKKILPILHTSIDMTADIEKNAAEGEYDFWFKDPTIDSVKIVEKKANAADTLTHLIYQVKALSELATFTAESIKEALWPYAESVGRGAALWPLRFALTGKDKSPDPFTVAGILGKETTLRRVNASIAALQSL